jgi:hypothetical protein
MADEEGATWLPYVRSSLARIIFNLSPHDFFLVLSIHFMPLHHFIANADAVFVDNRPSP